MPRLSDIDLDVGIGSFVAGFMDDLSQASELEVLTEEQIHQVVEQLHARLMAKYRKEARIA